MKPVKLIVSHKSNLQWKYGKNFSKVNALLKQMQAADKKKGLDTRIVFVDDAASLKSPGVKKIKAFSEQECKRVVDDLYKKYIPAYIILFGSQDIFPFQDLENPAEDEDMNVPSDLPYACDTPFSRKVENFTGPTRVVSRIPDLLGQQTDIVFLQKLMNNSIKHKPVNADRYRSYFAVSAYVWRKSTELSLQNMFGHNGKMLVSPNGKPTATYKPYSKKQLEPMVHFYNCHGAQLDLSYYGEKAGKFPEALQSANLPAKVTSGTVVAAECCYGAELFDHKQLGMGFLPIALNYLDNNALAFVGSSTIAYGPPDSQGLADLITQFFIKNVLKGASTGRSFLEARQKFLNDNGPDLDPFELKTIAQFYLLGDPSVQPAECEEAEVTKLSVGSAIMNSRKNLFMKGQSLAQSIGVTTKQKTTSAIRGKMPLSDNTQMTIEEILKKNNFERTDKKAVYAVRPKVSESMGIQKKFGGRNVKFHAYVQNPNERIKHIRVMVVKENSAQILGWKVYESK
jgi:hypothetical protein